MEDLKRHEQFEMEVLKHLSDNGLLNRLIFGGGTCLRLCFGLPRYSVDLDFWSRKGLTKKSFIKMKKVLEETYKITDFQAKHFTYLLEIRSPRFPHKIKIEIRKATARENETELNIAYSFHSILQVRLTTLTLGKMGLNKISALLGRHEARDAYDLEFIFKKGQADFKALSPEDRQKLIKALDSFKTRDIKVKLGSLLPPDERRYYSAKGFQGLKMALM